MKDAIDSLPADRPEEAEGFANRKLIRPSLNRNDHNHGPATHGQASHSSPTHSPVTAGESRAERPERHDRHERNERHGGGRKTAPPEQTNAENFYYQKQMQSKTPMVIVLGDGEEIHGMIEWYDKSCIKINRNSQSNLLVYKPAIKYMYKEGENSKK